MKKLEKNALPSGHSRESFKGFGPVVSKDTEWGGACLADLGCFKQEGVDSNKYYHLSCVQSTVNNLWYAYFEWGRTKPDGRPSSPAFQFFECISQEEAQSVCEDQFRSKNTKRGQWEKIGSKERYTPRVKKDGSTDDLYIVRPCATRLVGLPCVENIANDDAKGANAAPTPAPKNGAKKTKRIADPQTHKLFSDLLGGAVKYANTFMSGGSGKATLPTQYALDEGRDILSDAMARLAIVGDKVDDQVNDRTLIRLTSNLYGMIPKKKNPKAANVDWILSKDNIRNWQLDIDTLETALQAQSMDIEENDDSDVLAGIPAKVSWIDSKSGKGEWLENWWKGATRNRHGNVGSLRIHGMWEIERNLDRSIMRKAQDSTLREMPPKWNDERPLHQDRKRFDLSLEDRKMFWNSNTALMFHGTRSVNVPGIVRENLRFPKELSGVIISGAMFGPGSYFADDYKKSCGYCSNPNTSSRSYYGGGGEVNGRHAFMFAFDVICGNPHVADDAHGYTKPPSGHHCVYGKAGHTASWGTRGGLMNNEWIIYQKGRIEMRYLAEISW